MSDKVETGVLEAVKKMMAEMPDLTEVLVDSKDKKYWKEVDLPCDLETLLADMPKTEMDRIRKTYGFKNVSSLKKAELAKSLVELIPEGFKELVHKMDQEVYDFMQLAIKNDGIIYNPELLTKEADVFRDVSIFYTGIHKGQKALFMPVDLMKAFDEMDQNELKKSIQRNTEWIQLTQGMLYHYGVCDGLIIKNKIEKLLNQSIEWSIYDEIINVSGKVLCTPYGYIDYMVTNPERVFAGQEMRAELDYYDFSKKELLKASYDMYVPKTPEVNKFIKLLLNHYDLAEDELEIVLLDVMDIIRENDNPLAAIGYLEECIELPDMEFAQTLGNHLIAIYNTTRQWILKGHTPTELYQKDSAKLEPLKMHSVALETVASPSTQASSEKIGRNEPCPCGSGKKYKKCCGR